MRPSSASLLTSIPRARSAARSKVWRRTTCSRSRGSPRASESGSSRLLCRTISRRRSGRDTRSFAAGRGRSARRGPLVGHQRGQRRGEFRRAAGHLSLDPRRRERAARGARLLGEPLQRRVGQLSPPIQVAGRGFGDGRSRSAHGQLALLGRHVHAQPADRRPFRDRDRERAGDWARRLSAAS